MSGWTCPSWDDAPAAGEAVAVGSQMFEQAYTGCVADEIMPAPTMAMTATIAAPTMIRRYRWRNGTRAVGRARSRRPARSVPRGLLEPLGPLAPDGPAGRDAVEPLAGTWPV
jgi:hypothetical protein